MKKIVIVLCLFSCLHINLISQTVYELNLKKDVAIGVASAGAAIVPFFIDNEPGSRPGMLHKNDVNGFDRPLMFSYKKTLDLFSDNSAYALALFPVISIIPNIKFKNTVVTYAVMYSEALLLTYGTAFSLKSAVNRYRPYMYTYGIPHGKEKDYHNSFPSGAASFSFLGATFFSVTFWEEFPESKWKFPVLLGSHTLAAGVAAMRVLTGSHFLTDVLAGAAIGSLYGWLIPTMHLKNNNNRFVLAPAVNGLMISLRL